MDKEVNPSLLDDGFLETLLNEREVSVIKEVCNLLQLNHHKDIVRNAIQQRLNSKGDYKNMAYIIVHLYIQDRFSFVSKTLKTCTICVAIQQRIELKDKK